MMQENNMKFLNKAEQTLEEFKLFMGFNSDSDISTFFKIGRSAVSQWKAKDKIPRTKLYKMQKLMASEVTLTNDIEIDTADGTLIKEGEKYKMPIQAERIIENQLEQIDELKEKVAQLKKGGISYQPHPEAFNAVADGLENITKQWNWAFYHNSKPMSCSRDDTIRAINPALEKIIEWTEDELRGKSILDLVHKDDKEAVIQALSKVNRDLSVRIKKKNGRYCLMHVVAKEFGTNGKRYSIGLLTCVEKDCPDCDSEN